MKNNENPGKKPIPYLIKQEDLRMGDRLVGNWI